MRSGGQKLKTVCVSVILVVAFLHPFPCIHSQSSILKDPTKALIRLIGIISTVSV